MAESRSSMAFVLSFSTQQVLGNGTVYRRKKSRVHSIGNRGVTIINRLSIDSYQYQWAQ